MPGTPFSEDCLTVNIWTGARRPAEKRPVMVWVHGGGFEFGSSMEPNTDGARFAEKGVVLLSLNYRLGVFGFLAHPELDREGPSGDYGLQDQLAALQWVRANIAKFGGDPDNVTLAGESAGSHAIGILMASPLSKGLFQKAIGSSGAFWDGEHGSLATFEEAHERGSGSRRTWDRRRLRGCVRFGGAVEQRCELEFPERSDRDGLFSERRWLRCAGGPGGTVSERRADADSAPGWLE